MRILITGNMGYIGPALVAELRSRNPRPEIVGRDSGLFAHCPLDTAGSR
jgi:nucleoside-diphosphate-sugar epimerase